MNISSAAATAGASRRSAVSYGGDIVGFESLPVSLTDVLCATVAQNPDQKIVHIGPDGSETVQSYAELWLEATRILRGFRRLGLQPGAQIIFQLELSRDFIPAFWGAVLGGFVPVPVSVPTDYAEESASVLKVRNAWSLLSRPLVLTSHRMHENVRSMDRFSEMAGFESATVEALRNNPPDENVQDVLGETMALMMLTSGSTGVPKGVMLTHRNLIARSAGSVQMNGFSAEDVSLSWMPLDHVASLIYFHLRDVFTGCRQIHVSPQFILQNPLRWLDLIHRFRVSVTFAPNFAFGLLNERAKEIRRRNWDLSSLRYLLNGGEAIVPRTARQSMQLLAMHGLKSDAMRPAWGMSEISSGVTYGDRFRLNMTSDDDAFAEVGLPIPGASIRIVNEQDEAVAEGDIGRLQFKGLTLMTGYYNNPELNKEVFTADGWFKTGDLGYLRDGRLTITGREKDVIIINGVNYYSHEIESVVEQIHGVEVSYVAACAVRRNAADSEALAIFFTPSDFSQSILPDLLAQIRAQVTQRNGIKPEYLIPLPKAEIPKTEIGKIQRPRLKARFEKGEFDEVVQQMDSVVAEHRKKNAPQTHFEKKLADIWCDVLGLSEVSRNESFFAVGGASLAANRVISRTREQLNVELPLTLLFSHEATLAKVAEYISQQEKTEVAVIPTVSRDNPLPLSFPQQRIWIDEQIAPGSTRYNVARALWLRGPLDIDALTRALNVLVERHEILRTTFSFRDGAPVQIVHPPFHVALEQTDLTGDAEAESKAIDLAEAELQTPFELTRLPLFRTHLYRTTEQSSLLLICFHQIVVDGWSIGVLLSDLKAAYEAAIVGSEPDISPLPIQYADFAAWQRSQQSQQTAKQLEYWRQQLAGVNPVLEWLPAKPCRADARTVRLCLSKSLCSKLRDLNKAHDSTPFVTLLAAYKALLRSYGTQDDICVGTAVSGRNRTEIENLIGFFVNTLALRDQVPPQISFQELLARVRKTSLEAMANADVPFEKLVEQLRPQRGASDAAPFFQAWFSFMDAMADSTMADLAVSPIHIPPSEAQFALSLFVIERADQIDCFFEYKTELISSQQIQVIMQAYEALLTRAIDNPEMKLQELFNGVAVPVSKPEKFDSIHQWFEYQARKTPNAVAVTCGENFLSYGNLNRRANQLARFLQKSGVRTDSLVGISLDRSREMLVAILGVLKAGGAYVPLDPSYPKERLQQMVEEIQAPVLITSSKYGKDLPESGARIVCIDSDWSSISTEADTNLAADVSPDNLAYAIFTSGSTGKPKGVLITHGNLLHSTRARFEYYEEPIRAYLMISSFSFDSSVAGIFWTICSGGNLVLPEEGLHKDPAELARAIERNRVTHFLGLPSLYSLVLQEPNVERIRTLRAVIVAGEACSAELVERHTAALPHARLYNEYGPTEGTVWCTVARLRPGEKVTIGRAIPATEVYILDENGKPVRGNEAGEIYVGGPGVALGYLNKPEATATKFVPDHLSGRAGARLYRTGDLARYLPNGDIEFLGRIDHQVKIRGFRIELEEIEAVLQEFAGVRNVVVNAFQPTPQSEKMLVAYIVAGSRFDAAELRQFLKQRLPDYMVPSTVVFLESMPLMPNGKVDRAALPAPTELPATVSEYIAPRTPSEEQIAVIWQELLQKEKISIHENFFELGGHSLLGIQIMARVREQFQVEIPLKHIFEAPTIAGLAERVFEHLVSEAQQGGEPVSNPG